MLDWVVIGPTKFSSTYTSSGYRNIHSYKLSEGDFIKFGKLTFLVRKLKRNSTLDLKNTKKNNESNSLILDNSNSNMNININNSINEEIVIYNRNQNYVNNNNDNNNLNLSTNNALLYSSKTKNYSEINNNNYNIVSESANNKLKNIYIKLKKVNKNEKAKHFNCRICFCEGNFEGKDPLISPCKCTGSVSYIHLNCLRKWLTSKIIRKSSSSNNIYCYTYKSLECEICKTRIPEIVEYRGKYISLLEFKDIDPPYIILQSMNQYNLQNRNLSDLNAIFVISLKLKDYLLIGRANNSDIRLNDVSVSRNHSIISYNDGNFYIEDIGSKFGTLLLIQNNILFLPYKDISIQTGKYHLIFKLKRTFLGCFKCIQNKQYEKMSYEDNFQIKDKKVYIQIIENFNNNIVDPIEKFSSINGSCSENNSNNNNINNDINIIENKNYDDNVKTERINTTNKNENNNQKNIIENPNSSYLDENDNKNGEIKGVNNSNKKLNGSTLNENNISINKLIQRRNGGNGILFSGKKNTYFDRLNLQKNKSLFQTLNFFNKKNNLNRNTTMVKTRFNDIYYTNINRRNQFSGLSFSARENKRNTQRFYEINNS